MKLINNKKALKYSFLFSIIVFIFGFGIMCFLYYLWKKENPTSLLPGLFDYKAAALGDPLCLPLIIGVLIYHHCKQEKSLRSFSKTSIIFGIIAFICGVSIQVEWLTNDNTGLNWSIPKPHFFNIGGWYHAIFFVIIVTTIILLLVNYVWDSDTFPSFTIDYLLFLGIIFFCLLHFIDDYIKKDSPFLSLTIADILFVALCCSIKLIQCYKLHKYKIFSFIPIILAGGTAYFLCLFQV